MTARQEWFVNLKILKKEIPVRIGNGKYISASGRGDINILAFDGHTWNEKYLSNVLYVPQLKYNLFSAGAALDKGLKLHSDNEMCKLKRDGKTVLMGERQGKLYQIKIKITPAAANPEAHATICTFHEWHERMTHRHKTQGT